MCEGNEHSVEKSVSMCDLVFLNRSEQPLDCGTASSLAVGSGRREHQFHLQFPFQLFLCFTLVQMETCKGPQEPVCIMKSDPLPALSTNPVCRFSGVTLLQSECVFPQNSDQIHMPTVVVLAFGG